MPPPVPDPRRAERRCFPAPVPICQSQLDASGRVRRAAASPTKNSCVAVSMSPSATRRYARAMSGSAPVISHRLRIASGSISSAIAGQVGRARIGESRCLSERRNSEMRFAVWASSAGNEGRSLVVAPDVIDGNGGVVLQIEPAAGGAAGGVGSAPDGQSRDADAKQHTAWFDRTSETSEADLIGRGFSRIGAGATFHGVCGLVKLRNEIWLGLVKEAAPVCTVQNRLVYKITQVCFVSLASDYYDGAVLGSLPAETLDQGANKEQDARHPCQDIIVRCVVAMQAICGRGLTCCLPSASAEIPLEWELLL